eukprot:CAMPEP_0183468030 /NCGR_PEP_ID=MMETSP0370-20130417/152018_1 /TAXON_ID=268820 /ORGANISM="Peridinium aciculiferum, Strain PAER-2" /LENGTH=86 /DNA_ID=CAMNT_0025660401 /DNA_START=20 /DNA_END=280 /DNA_ORIENTATION=-
MTSRSSSPESARWSALPSPLEGQTCPKGSPKGMQSSGLASRAHLDNQEGQTSKFAALPFVGDSGAKGPNFLIKASTSKSTTFGLGE